MKMFAMLLGVFAATAIAGSSARSFTPGELVTLALAENPELRFYQRQVAALPKPSDGESPVIPQPLDFPSRANFRRAVLNLDAELARLYLDEFRFALAGHVRLKAIEYQAALETSATAGELASGISMLVRMLEERPAAGVQALIERRILEGAALPFVRRAAAAGVRANLLRTELNGLLGREPDAELSVTGSFVLPPDTEGTPPQDSLLLKIREAEIARGLAGLDAASEVESFSVVGWFTREGLGAGEAISGATRPGATAGSSFAETRERLIADARGKLAREFAQRQTAVRAALMVGAAIPANLIENLKAASDLAERQYRVGALGVNLLVEAHREYLDALEGRNEAVIQAWRNRLDLDLITLRPSTSLASKVTVDRKSP